MSNTSATQITYPVVQGNVASVNDLNQCLFMNPGPWVQIQSMQVSTTASSVTFTNIPPYNNLMITWQARSDAASQTAGIYFAPNNSFTSNWQILQAASTSVVATPFPSSTAGGMGILSAATAGTTAMYGSGFCAIPNWGQANTGVNWTSISTAFYVAGANGIEFEMIGGQFLTVSSPPIIPNTLQLLTTGNFAGTVAGGCLFTIYGSN